MRGQQPQRRQLGRARQAARGVAHSLCMLALAGLGVQTLHGADAVLEFNSLCWESRRVEELRLTKERCCGAGDGASAGDDGCWEALDGWYSYEFCCQFSSEAVTQHCDWPSVLVRLLGNAALGQRQGFHPNRWMFYYNLADEPMAAFDFCCFMPDMGAGMHSCWDELPPLGPGLEDLPRPWVECCFPLLRRRLQAGGEGISTLPGRLLGSLREELQALEDAPWLPPRGLGLSASLDAHDQEGSLLLGNRPCRVWVRNGELHMCDRRLACVGFDDDDPHNDCSYFGAVHRALAIIHALHPFPDGLDLLVSPGNHDSEAVAVPIFTRARPKEPRSHYLLLPMEWQLHPWQVRKHVRDVTRHNISWEDKLPEVLWRGSNSNCMASCRAADVVTARVSWDACTARYDCRGWDWESWLWTPRGRAVALSQFHPALDARFTGRSHPVADGLWQHWVDSGFTAESVGKPDHAEWRYHLVLLGTGNADRIYWLLFSGAVVLLQETPWNSWLLAGAPSALLPYEHYVPVKYDLSDLLDQIDWLLANDSESQRIARAAKAFAQAHLNPDSILLYTSVLLRRYAALAAGGGAKP